MRLLSMSRFWGSLVVALALSLSLVGLGCQELSPTNGGTAATVGSATTGLLDGGVSTEISISSTDTSTRTTASPGTTPTTEALSSAEGRLASGHISAMGYIEDVWEDSSGRHLSIDYVEWLDGEEATAAAIAQGALAPGEEWDLDFYISNVNPKLREFDILNAVAITTSSRVLEEGGDIVFFAPCTWADFLSFWGPEPFQLYDDLMHSRLWSIERDGNTVVKIDEQYVP
jgi:hypothetical protein